MKKEIIKQKDKKYKEFHQKLVPTIDKDLIIGVRIPALRKIAKDNKNNFKYLEKEVKYQEEKLIKAFIINEIEDLDKALYYTELFLPTIDSWVITDACKVKAFKKDLKRVYSKIKEWLNTDSEYIVRYAVVALLKFYSEDHFKKEILGQLLKVKNREYYVNMAISWYLCELVIKQYDIVIEYFEKKKFSKFIHNKAISKSKDSFRVSKEIKEYLNSLKIK